MGVAASFIAILGFAMFASACSTTPSDRTTLDSIPKAAAASLRTEAKGAEIRQVSREIEAGAELYEASWIENGLQHEVKVTATGTIVEHEREVKPADVPAAVRDAALAALPGATSISYVLLMNGNYEAEAIIAGKERDAVITPAGTPAAGDDDDAGDDGNDD